VLAVKEINRGFDFQAGVDMIAAGGMGVVNDYWLRIEARLLGLFWSR